MVILLRSPFKSFCTSYLRKELIYFEKTKFNYCTFWYLTLYISKPRFNAQLTLKNYLKAIALFCHLLNDCLQLYTPFTSHLSHLGHYWFTPHAYSPSTKSSGLHVREAVSDTIITYFWDLIRWINATHVNGPLAKELDIHDRERMFLKLTIVQLHRKKLFFKATKFVKKNSYKFLKSKFQDFSQN